MCSHCSSPASLWVHATQEAYVDIHGISLLFIQTHLHMYFLHLESLNRNNRGRAWLLKALFSTRLCSCSQAEMPPIFLDVILRWSDPHQVSYEVALQTAFSPVPTGAWAAGTAVKSWLGTVEVLDPSCPSPMLAPVCSTWWLDDPQEELHDHKAGHRQIYIALKVPWLCAMLCQTFTVQILQKKYICTISWLSRQHQHCQRCFSWFLHAHKAQAGVCVRKIQLMPQSTDSALTKLLANHLSPSCETALKLHLFSLPLSLQKSNYGTWKYGQNLVPGKYFKEYLSFHCGKASGIV